MSAVNVRTGLIERLATIEGLVVWGAEPLSIQTRPIALVSLSGGSLNAAGQVKSKTWRFAVRIVIAKQDAVTEEQQLTGFADALIAAILADLGLGGRASVVPAIEIGSEGPDGYYTVNSIDYRSFVARMDIRDKLP